MEEKELFEDYEMRGWQLTSRIYKILGVAVIANLLVIYTFSQINFFTARGCDTPYVGMVCQVLDSAYVASVFLGKETGMENRPYEPRELEDADITYIDVSDKLEYPEGYFALANPPEEQVGDSFQVTDSTGTPTTIDPNSPITTTPSDVGDLMSKPQVTPTPNKDNDNQEVVDSPFEIASGKPAPSSRPGFPGGKSPTIARPKKTPQLSNVSPGTLPKFGGGPKATPTPTPIKTPPPTPTPEATPTEAELAARKINKEPFSKLAEKVIINQDEKDENKKIDLKQPFTVVLNGVLTKDGTFDQKASKFDTTKLKGSQEMQNFAKDAIEAIGDSTILSYLQGFGVDKVNITLVQDDKQITALIKSNQPTTEKAKTVSSGLGGWISLAKLSNHDEATLALLNGLKVTAEGKSFVINFAMPKDQAHKFIEEKVQKEREARQKKTESNNGGDGKQANAKTE